MLWHLAKRNISRNWSKYLLGILGVAVAAAVMTASLSLQTGYPENIAQPYRVFMGADLVIHPGTVGVDYNRESAEGESWEWSLRRDQELSDLWVFQPALYREGYIHPQNERASFVSDDLPSVLQTRYRPAQVVDMNPLLKMPVQVQVDGELHPAGLRGRDVSLDKQQKDRWEISDYLEDGRWLQPQDRQSMVAMAYGYEPETPVFEGSRPSYGVLPVGREVTLRVPRLIEYNEGFPVWDWEQYHTFEVDVVGNFSFTTEVEREDAVVAGELPEHAGALIITKRYLETDDLFIPQSTWKRIFGEIAPEGVSPRAYQVNVVLEDMFHAREVSETLGAELPGTTIRAVPDLARLGRQSRGQSVIPADVSNLVVGASFLIAGLLLVANMYLLVMQRRKDMAILKVVGMSPGQVMRLIVLESTLVSFIGGVIGFGLTRLAVTGVLSLSEVDAAEVGMLTLRTGGIVIGSSVFIALIFGLLPAYQAVRQTTMQVLRDVEV